MLDRNIIIANLIYPKTVKEKYNFLLSLSIGSKSHGLMCSFSPLSHFTKKHWNIESGKLEFKGFWALIVPSHHRLSIADRKRSPETQIKLFTLILNA